MAFCFSNRAGQHFHRLSLLGLPRVTREVLEQHDFFIHRAIGALAIGRLALKRSFVGQTRLRSVELDRLDVKQLRVGELVITDKLITPDNVVGKA